MSEDDFHTSQPIACSLTQAELASRRNELLPGLLGSTDSQEAIPGGFRWRFSETDGLLNQVVSVIEAESRCCRFLRFRLTFGPNGRRLWMEVTGPEGTQEFLSSLLSSAAPPSAHKN